MNGSALADQRAAESGPPEPVSILLVDDNRDSILALSAILESPGYRLVVAHSGPEALLALLREDFALVLLDVMMPGMDGWEVAKLIKERPRSQHTPIIFLTGLNTDVNYIYKAYSQGAVDYLEKPVNNDVVRAKVAVFVDLYRKQERLKRQAELLKESERTQRELAIANLQLLSDLRYRNLAESIPHVVWNANPDGSVKYFNQRWFDLTGLSPEVSLGWSWPMALHADDLDVFLHRWKRALATKEAFATECRLRRATDGSYRWHLCRALPESSANGEIVGWLGTFSDIDDLKRGQEERAALLVRERNARTEAESAQRRSEFMAGASKLLGDSLDYATTLVSVARLAVPELATWCAVWVNDSGHSPDRVVFAHVDSSKEAMAQDFMQKAGPAAPARFLFEVMGDAPLLVPEIGSDWIERVAPQLEQRRLLDGLGAHSAMLVPLTVRSRRLGAIAFVSADSQRKYEAADLAMAQDLARRAALAVENAGLYHQAHEAIRARDEFLLIASHELRTPLTALQLQVASVIRNMRKAPADATGWADAGRKLEVASRQIERLATLVDELLDVSRITTGRLQLELEEVSLAAVTRDVVARFEEEMNRAGIQAAVRTDGVATGRWDRVRLEQVLTNLLSNAVKYGSGRPIEIAVRSDRDRAFLAVRDHGIGIATEHHGLIFERFGRAVPGRNYGGLGLGLYIVQQIVQAHGGTIRVESELGKGSAFLVELPLEPHIAAPAGEIRGRSPDPGGSGVRAQLDS
jgi:PAS domain S-box-containing protein